MKTIKSPKVGKYWPLILILLFGTALRFYHNLDVSLWHDEAFSALMIRYPWGEMFYRLGKDVHPPMYYIFLRFWHNIFGDSLLSLRSFSIVFGFGSIWAAYAFVKEAFKNEHAALWAAVLVAINPFQLQYVTEARMYTMGAFFALLAAYFLTKALNQQKFLFQEKTLNTPNLPDSMYLRKKMIAAWVLFTLCMIIIIYTHYYLFFTAAAIGVYGIGYLYFHHQGNWKKYFPLLLSFIFIAISFLPWLKIFLSQLKQVGASYWIPPINFWSIPGTFWDMLLGLGRDVNKPGTQFWLIVVTLFSFYVLYRFLKKTESFHKYLVVLAVLAPFAGALMFAFLAKLKGSSTSVYLDRYFLFASIFYSVALAVWLKEFNLKWLSLSLFLVYCALNLATFGHYWSELNVQAKPGMSAAAKYLLNNATPHDMLYVGSSFMFFNFKYYWTATGTSGTNPKVFDTDTGYYFDNNIRPLLFTGGTAKVSEISHFAGSALLSDSDLLPDFKSSAHSGDTVWLVWTNGFGASKPEVPKNWTSVDEKSFAEVRPYVGTYVYVTEYKVN